MDRRAFLKKGTAVAGAAISQGLLKPLAATEPPAESRAQGISGSTLLQAESSGALFADDFSAFPTGWLSRPIGQLNGAIQEYHYLANRGVPLGSWANAIAHMDAWVVADEDGKPYVEQHLVNDLAAITNPILLAGDPEWNDCSVEVKVKPLSLADMSGIVFRYHTNRHYYLFALTEGKYARLVVRLPLENTYRIAEWRELGRREFPYECKKFYALKVENAGARIRAYVDGQMLLEVSDEELMKGKAGLTANIPARFQDFGVTASPQTRTQIANRVRSRDQELAQLRAENPQPKLWKKFSTPKFGAGRSARFGDLDGDGQLDMLIAQNIPRVSGDGHDHISCLTAVTLDGTVLWQSGRADPRNGLLTNDVPFQIHDVDGDGRNEVVLIRDFKLQILEGISGNLKRWAWMPAALPAAGGSKPPYQFENGDAIAFVNVSGAKDRRDILVKDRYRNFWIFNNALELLWKGQGQTGHFPYPFDIDGDGHDEILLGYALWDHTGRQLWSHDDELRDHADAVFLGTFSGDPKAEPRAYACGSDEGLLIFGKDGKVLNHVRIGHAQSASIGKYRPDLPGLQYLTVNFWRNPGIVTLFDSDGNILAQEEPIHSGSPLLPVNWRGDGQEFALLSGNVREGGMIDGNLRRVVMFPDDGHPDLCAYVADVTGDPRDEVILWDQERVWIYTQDRPFTGKQIYSPLRSPHYNESNYRTQVSFPGWREQ
jgi:rhamnogalacturonan endolyase